MAMAFSVLGGYRSSEPQELRPIRAYIRFLAIRTMEMTGDPSTKTICPYPEDLAHLMLLVEILEGLERGNMNALHAKVEDTFRRAYRIGGPIPAWAIPVQDLSRNLPEDQKLSEDQEVK